jgi:hypothetical protein
MWEVKFIPFANHIIGYFWGFFEGVRPGHLGVKKVLAPQKISQNPSLCRFSAKKRISRTCRIRGILKVITIQYLIAFTAEIHMDMYMYCEI